MTDREKDNAGVIAPPPVIYVGPLALGLLINRFRPLALAPRRVARMAGWPLVVGGVTLVAWAIVTFRRARTPLNPSQPVTQIVTSGPFRFTRNPIYASLTAIYVGTACLANALWPLLWLPAVLAVMQRGVIEREERYLSRTFGADYDAYKARVRRWL